MARENHDETNRYDWASCYRRLAKGAVAAVALALICFGLLDAPRARWALLVWFASLQKCASCGVAFGEK